MPISAPPTIPQITDPSTFATRAQAWVVWQADELYPALEDSATILTLSTSSTSTTSNTIGTGSKSFTVETGKGYLAGQSLSIAYTTTPTNRMFAVVTSYNSGTGALVVDVQAIEGSGTYTAWSIALAFNGVIGTGQLADNAVTLAKLARVGTAGQVLTSGGAGADPSYSTITTPDATETVKGIVELATDAEAQAYTANKFIDGSKLNTALQGSNQSLAASGYQKLPGGVIIQWGVFTNGQTTLTFPIAFPTACRAVTQMQSGSASNSVTRIAFNGALSASSVAITGTSASGIPSTWIAIGY